MIVLNIILFNILLKILTPLNRNAEFDLYLIDQDFGLRNTYYLKNAHTKSVTATTRLH